MKKILLVMSVAILIAFCSAPSIVKAAWGDDIPTVGYVYYAYQGGTPQMYPIKCRIEPTWVYLTGVAYNVYTAPTKGSTANNRALEIYRSANSSSYISYNYVIAMYIPTLDGNYSFSGSSKIFNNVHDFNQLLPENDRLPEPTWLQNLWSEFYDFLEFQLGLDPFDGGIWEFFHDYINSDNPVEMDLIFPTNTPTPTPTPRPTPIPVQTIYVPDGNGSYTIVYQYPDPNGNITQSPYNPNVEVNVDVDCDCSNGNDYNPQDPMYYPFDGLTWASIDGGLSDTPAMSAGQSLDIIKAEVDSYDEPIKVVSNSFGALPSKWLGLVGLLGACLIVAGLIRTFLGG